MGVTGMAGVGRDRRGWRLARAAALLAGLSVLFASTLVGTSWGAPQGPSGDVDNSAGKWHPNNCGSGACVVQANGDVRFTLENNIQCGATRHLHLRLLFTKPGTVSKGAVVASCAQLPKVVVLATNVLATTKIKVEAMSDVGIPTFHDTRFSGSIGNVR